MEDIVDVTIDDDLDNIVDDMLDSSSEEDNDGDEVDRADRIMILRDRPAAERKFYYEYFADNAVYHHKHFKRRFRVSKFLFNKICARLSDNDPYFKQRRDCTGKEGFSTRLKCAIALRLLATGIACDGIDDIYAVGDSTALEILLRFCSAVTKFFPEFLQSPTDDQVRVLLQRAEQLEFTGMLGCLDCCKWNWDQCPVAYQGQYKGKEKVPVLTLEAICDDRMYFWHAFFGMAGCNNDRNVLDNSPLLSKISAGTYPPPIEYPIDGVTRRDAYWLVDSIYLRMPFFLLTIRQPVTPREKYFAKRQEGRRKDIERAFGVLRRKFHILKNPSRLRTVEKMRTVALACVALHNMNVDEREPLKEIDHDVATTGQIRVNEEGMRPAFFSIDGFVPELGTVAADVHLNAFMRNRSMNSEKIKMVMDYLWNLKGDMSSSSDSESGQESSASESASDGEGSS